MMKTNSFRTRLVLINLITSFVIVLCSGIPALSKPSHLYASGTNGEGTSTLYKINVHTGAAKSVNDFKSIDEIHSVGGLAFDTDHGILYATAPTEAPWPILSVSGLYTVDVKTAFSSFIGVSDSSERLSGGLSYESNHLVLYAH